MNQSKPWHRRKRIIIPIWLPFGFFVWSITFGQVIPDPDEPHMEVVAALSTTTTADITTTTTAAAPTTTAAPPTTAATTTTTTTTAPPPTTATTTTTTPVTPVTSPSIGSPAPTPASAADASLVDASTVAPALDYPNCEAVRDAGASPLHQGQPGYSTRLDQDGDGVACE